MLSHDVFFSLTDKSPEAAARLVWACHHYLSAHDGIVHFTAGARETSLDREVNDQDFEVALHVVFADRAAHDAYQDAPGHHAFIEENSDVWTSVRVFDSTVTGGAR